MGIVHGDIRPHNFLVDEYGILKLSDFKKAKMIPKECIGEKSMEERGYIPYLAPELFTSQGVYSFQSDFWSFGCLLYELRRGFAPFGDSSTPTEKIHENVRNAEPINSPLMVVKSIPSLSAELADLLLWLLEKSPGNRCSWYLNINDTRLSFLWFLHISFFRNDLCTHPFWQASNLVAPTNQPSQPAFENFVR